jgi:menaquinone-dependent protoporphyrinogen IX oxidase
MNAAIFFSSKYGSTEQYANWIGEATALPVFDVKDNNADPSKYDFLILGSPIIYYKLSIHKWVKKHLSIIGDKPLIFFSVSGAGAGPKLDGWIGDSLPQSLISKMKHVALRGRQIPAELTWFDRMMLIMAGSFNTDRVAGKEELKGFDYMDKESIEPILKLIRQLKHSEVPVLN